MIKLSHICSIFFIPIILSQNCENGWYSYKKNCYFVGTDQIPWNLAESACQKLDGHLASLLDKDEQVWVYENVEDLALTMDAVAIGLHRLSGANYEWTDGNAYEGTVFHIIKIFCEIFSYVF